MNEQLIKTLEVQANLLKELLIKQSEENDLLTNLFIKQNEQKAILASLIQEHDNFVKHILTEK